MSLFILDAIFRVFGIRGHIPGRDDFDGGPDRSSFGTDSDRLMRYLAVFVVVAALLSLLLWATVWLPSKRYR